MAAVALCYDAFEQAMKWLERAGVITVSREGAGEHAERIRIASNDPRIALHGPTLHKLRRWARGDTYGDDSSGKQILVGSHEARRSVEIAREAVRRIGACNLSESELEVLEELLELSPLTEAHSGLLTAIEWSVVRGHYGGPLDDELDRLARQFRRPHTSAERITSGRVALLVAHRAMNQGIGRGASGAIAWSELAIKLLAMADELPRLVHLHALRTIVFGQEGDVGRASAELEHGRKLARGKSDLLVQLGTEEVMLLAATGRADRAQGLALELLERARSEGDRDTLAKRHRKVGAVFMRTDRIDDAEEHLVRGVELVSDSYVMARCVAAADLMEFYRRTGQFDKTMTYATMVSRLATDRGLRRQALRAQRIFTEMGQIGGRE